MGNKLSTEVEKLKKEFYERLNRVDKQIEGLTSAYGKFVEGLVEPNVAPLFKRYGIKITGTSTRALRRYNGQSMEVDVLATGRCGSKNLVIYIEAKTDPSQKDVQQLIQHMGRFSTFFPEYKGWVLFGSIAGIKISSGVADHAIKSGLFVLSPGGNTMKLLNKEGFKPKVWG